MVQSPWCFSLKALRVRMRQLERKRFCKLRNAPRRRIKSLNFHMLLNISTCQMPDVQEKNSGNISMLQWAKSNGCNLSRGRTDTC